MIDFFLLDLRRLFRRSEAWAPVLGGTVLFLAGLVLERASTAKTEMRDVFGRAAFPVLLSLLALAIAQGTSGGAVPSPASRVFLRVGGSRILATLATATLSMLLMLILFPTLGFLALRMTRDVPPDQIATVLGILCLVAPAYAAAYAFALTFGVRGAGLFWLLDYVVGASGGPLGLFFPRSHLRNLLGATPPFGISPFTSSLILGALPLVYLVAATIRAERKGLEGLAREA